MIAIGAAFTSSVEDPDFWWHLRTGYWMIQNRRLPSQDLYTYTVSSHPWIDHEYLAEILIAYLNSWGGLIAISLVFAALTWFGFLLLYRTAGAGRRPYVIAGLGLVLGALTLFLFLGGLRAFERASVTTIKSLFAWIAARNA